MTEAGQAGRARQDKLRWLVPFLTGAALIQIANISDAFTKLYRLVDSRQGLVLEFRTPAIPTAQNKPQLAVFRGTVSRVEIAPGCWRLQVWTTLESKSDTPYLVVDLLKNDKVIESANNEGRQVSQLLVLPPIEHLDVRTKAGDYFTVRVDQASGGGDVPAKGEIRLVPQPFYCCW